MSSKLTLFTLFLIFVTLFIIFVKFRHYLNKLDIIRLDWFKIGTKWVNWLKVGSNGSKMSQNGSNSIFCRESCYVAIRRFFGHYFLKIDIILSNIRHYLCNFGRHYLSNFQITGLNMSGLLPMIIVFIVGCNAWAYMRVATVHAQIAVGGVVIWQ